MHFRPVWREKWEAMKISTNQRAEWIAVNGENNKWTSAVKFVYILYDKNYRKWELENVKCVTLSEIFQYLYYEIIDYKIIRN